MPKTLDITGQRFGRLIAIQPTGNRYQGCIVWLCKCDCYNFRTVAAVRLLDGRIASCGCKKSSQQNGSKNNPLIYAIWNNIRGRCNNPNHWAYRWYGARGIKLCERWNDFNQFMLDIGERPPGLTLDRRNNDGNYEPGNMRWATPKEQANNRRKSSRRAGK